METSRNGGGKFNEIGYIDGRAGWEELRVWGQAPKIWKGKITEISGGRVANFYMWLVNPDGVDGLSYTVRNPTLSSVTMLYGTRVKNADRNQYQ